MKKKIITICSSVSFYQDLFAIEEVLKKKGFSVLIPDVAREMQKKNNFDVASWKTWLTDPKEYHKKTKLMKGHFDKVLKADAILVVNNTKHGMKGYIGGNTLMEMVLTFHYTKPIYILHPVSEDLSIREEVYGLEPIFLNGNIDGLQL